MSEGTFKDNGEEITFELQLPPKTTRKLFPIKAHILSAHLSEGNAPISHEWNTWILMNFVIAAKSPPSYTHTPCMYSIRWPSAL